MADRPRLNGLEGSLALVRHGESTWIAEGRFQGQADPPLSSAGLLQAAAVAGRLADPGAAPSLPLPSGPPIAVWHSPLARAASTAGAIGSARRDVKLISEPDLAELAQGDWEGLPHHEVRTRYAAELAAWRSDPLAHHAPRGEPLGDAAERARRALGRVLAALAPATSSLPPGPAPSPTDAPAEPVLGYGGRPGGSPADSPPWGIVVAHDGILRLLLLQLLGMPIDRYWTVPFGLCCVSVVEIRAGTARLRAHNLAEHLSSAP